MERFCNQLQNKKAARLKVRMFIKRRNLRSSTSSGNDQTGKERKKGMGDSADGDQEEKLWMSCPVPLHLTDHGVVIEYELPSEQGPRDHK